MAKFIDLTVITSGATEEMKTVKVTFNSDCIVRFENVNEYEARYWGYPYALVEYTNGVQYKEIRVTETQEEIKNLINN
jgi:hypothetical protein